MNFLDEAVYNVKKGNMPPDPTTLDKDDVVNIGEKNLDPVGMVRKTMILIMMVK
jgi:hypothetical protein